MIDNILDQNLEEQIRNGVGIVRDVEADKLLFKDLKEIDGLKEYLVFTLAQDMKRYFISPKEQQDFIKGHYALAYYLYKKLTTEDKKTLHK